MLKHRGGRSLTCLPWALDDILPARIMILFFLHVTTALTLQHALIIHSIYFFPFVLQPHRGTFYFVKNLSLYNFYFAY